jgi:hypothetical protein
MNRFERRKRLLSQKAQGCFDANQYYLERDENSRVLRKLRVLLRKMEPVSLVGTAWDPRTKVILDLSAALAMGSPSVWLYIANGQEVCDWDADNTEKWLISRVSEALGLTSVSSSVSQLQGESLSECLSELLELSTGRVRTALCLHGFHLIESTVAEAFSTWMSEYNERSGCHDRVITFLTTGPKGSLSVPGLSLTLPEWDGLVCGDDEYEGPARVAIPMAV